ncbi:MAG: hypothetical protein JWR32_6078 [Mycobacterium sp.]|jgi:hypothetical protein|nr:hypothetical protein [Mycobacterium sp.]
MSIVEPQFMLTLTVDAPASDDLFGRVGRTATSNWCARHDTGTARVRESMCV